VLRYRSTNGDASVRASIPQHERIVRRFYDAILRISFGLRHACVLLVGCALAFAVAAAENGLQPIPSLTARVTDITGTLDAPRQKLIEDRLAALEQRKGAQVAVLIVPTTAPETIEQYATRVFDAWKLGRKNVDDGVLVVIARDDRRVRIEVAYGLEGAIPDAAAFRIAHEYMTPKFRDGDFAGGIDAGIDMLTLLIDEEPLPPPQPQTQVKSAPIPEPWWSPVEFVVGILFGGIFGVIVVLILGRPRVYRVVLGRVSERARTFAIGVITAVPITLLMRHPMAMLGAMAAGSSLSAITGLSKTPRPSRRSGGSGGGGWSSGGGSGDSGSSSSSSSSSGSDFSGGGGSSGGGGASDSW
jgi:uncharacterized protein